MITGWRDEAAWYDVFNPWGTSDDFYLGLVMCGLDPDKGVTRARQRDHTRRGGDIEWVLADAASMSWDRGPRCAR